MNEPKIIVVIFNCGVLLRSVMNIILIQTSFTKSVQWEWMLPFSVRDEQILATQKVHGYSTMPTTYFWLFYKQIMECILTK